MSGDIGYSPLQWPLIDIITHLAVKAPVICSLFWVSFPLRYSDVVQANSESALFPQNLPGVGTVPVDGIAIGHHLGARLLAKYTHPKDQADENDHFHLQHNYSKVRHVLLFCVNPEMLLLQPV